MDITSLYYFSELAKDLHMTRTANRLFISQQTLSNHILRLEEYYGTQLFYRKPSLSLTNAGEFVLAFANIVIKEETNLKDILGDIEQQERGVLRFGASSLRINSCLPTVLPEFSKRYPRIEMRITEANSSRLLPMVLNGELDFAVMLKTDPTPKLIFDDLMKDLTYFCIRDDLLRQYYGDQTEAFKERAVHGLDLLDISPRVPLCLLDNRIGREIQGYLDDSSIRPTVYATSSDVEVSYSICCNGLAGSFISQMRLVRHQGRIPDQVNIFPLSYRGKPIYQYMVLARHRDRYLSHYAKYFLDLLYQLFSETEEKHMGHKAPPHKPARTE